MFSRKVSRAKWEQQAELSCGEIGADAITELKTTGNALSFWRCASAAEADLKKAVLAIASAGDRLDKVDLAWVAANAVSQAGLATQDTPGDTPVESLRPLHVDVVGLDLVRHGSLARLVHEAIAAGQVKRLSATNVKLILNEAVDAGLLKLDDLSEKLQSQIAPR